LKAIDEQGSYEADSSILLYGIFRSDDELKECAVGHAFTYESNDLPRSLILHVSP
jgi:hypothetical protein